MPTTEQTSAAQLKQSSASKKPDIFFCFACYPTRKSTTNIPPSTYLVEQSFDLSLLRYPAGQLVDVLVKQGQLVHGQTVLGVALAAGPVPHRPASQIPTVLKSHGR